jgi:hypothetical protein
MIPNKIENENEDESANVRLDENENENEYEEENENSLNAATEDDDLLEAEALENRFIAIGPNQKQTVYVLRGFDPVMQKPRIRPIQKEYQGQKLDKTHFDVFTATDILEGKVTENKIKWFDTGKRSGRLLYQEVKDGNQLVDIKHTGDGKETLYIPTACNNPQLLKAIQKLQSQLQALQPRHLNGE